MYHELLVRFNFKINFVKKKNRTDNNGYGFFTDAMSSNNYKIKGKLRLQLLVRLAN